MIAVKIDTDNKLELIESELETIREAVGVEELGHQSLGAWPQWQMEHKVRIAMWCDDIALLRADTPPENKLATIVYNTGHVIRGNVVLQAYDLAGETASVPDVIIENLRVLSKELTS